MKFQGKLCYRLVQFIFVLFLWLFSFTAYAQKEVYQKNLKDNGRIQVFSGSVPLIFSTFKQYNDANSAGRIFTQQTTIKIELKDSSDFPNWELQVYALDDAFYSETSSILLADLTLEAIVISNSKTTASLASSFSVISNPIDPLDPSTIIISGTGDGLGDGKWSTTSDNAVVTLSISYKLTGNLIVLPAEVYFNQLQFNLYTW